MTVPSHRQAAKLLGITPGTVWEYVETGRLPPPPWTVEQLEVYRDRPGSPFRHKGTRARHGTTTRYAAGCDCEPCAAANRKATTANERARSERNSTAAQRVELLEQLRAGVLFPSALKDLGVRPGMVWGRARWDPAWSVELTTTLDQHRPAHLPHGKQRAYVAVCRCSECRRFSKSSIK